MSSRKFWILAATALALAGYLAACGGSGATITPPPPAGNFTNGSLEGQYAFSMSGVDLISGAHIARIGSFVADGQGHITTGLEDVLDLGSGNPASLATFSNGTYQIEANGRGLIVLNVTGGGSLQLSASLLSSSRGYLVQTDGLASTSGGLELQTPLQFSANAINGKYVFDFSGTAFHAGATPSIISLVGEFGADGNGTVTGGTADVNDSSVAPTGATALAASTYQLDTNGNGANFGRGMMTLNGRTYAFYIVDGTRVKFLEEDLLGGTAGEAILQTGVIPTTNPEFKGSFVFLTGGSETTDKRNFGPDARVGRLTADGAGEIGTISFHENKNGNNAQVSPASGISNTSYAIDANNAGSGRGTFTFRNSSVGTVTYVFYLYSPTRAVIQDVSAGILADGTMMSQSAASFTGADVVGNYSFGWSGLELVQPSPFDENFVGQFAQTSASTSNVAGVVDYAQLGLNTINTNGVTLNAGISGTLTVAGDGTQNNGYKIVIGGPSAFTVNFVAYFGDGGTIWMVNSDGNRTTAGVATPQTQ